MNETLIGIPLPSWMFLIAKSAIPSRWRTEALLHARAYNPMEALDRSIVHAVSEDAEGLTALVRGAIEELLHLDLSAYSASKKNLRQAETEHVLGLLMQALSVEG